MSLSGSVHTGVRWVGTGLVTSHIAGFVTTAILARLLVPEQFGLVGMALVTIHITGVLRQIGFGQAFIQRIYDGEALEQRAASTMFVTVLALNGILYLLVFVAAPWVADFFRSAQVAPVLRWLAVGFLIDAFVAVPRALLRKRLAFRSLASGTIAGSVSNAAVAIPAAFYGLGVWSLVAGNLASQMSAAAILLIRARWRPSREFSKTDARQLFSFGKFLLGFGLVSAIGDSLDRLVIGRMLGAAPLGVYSVAFNLARLPPTMISNLVNQISFPVFSRLQRERETLQRAFLKAVSHVAVLAIPASLGIIALAEDLILLVYGEKWRAAIPVVQLLAFYGAALAISSPAGPVFQAIGRPRLLLYMAFVHQGLRLILLVLLAHRGVLGVAYAVLIPMIVSAVLTLILVVRHLQFHPRRLLEPLARCAASSLLMFVAVIEFHAWLSHWSGWPRISNFTTAVAVGLAVYLLAGWLANRAVIVDAARTARSLLLGQQRSG